MRQHYGDEVVDGCTEGILLTENERLEGELDFKKQLAAGSRWLIKELDKDKEKLKKELEEAVDHLEDACLNLSSYHMKGILGKQKMAFLRKHEKGNDADI